MSYVDFIRIYISNNKVGQPIYSSKITSELMKAYSLSEEKASAATAVSLKRILEGNKTNLRCFQKGIYYLTDVTPFGEVNIDVNQIIYDKYLKDGQGYETGLSFMNKLGLTTQMSNSRELVTNASKNGTRFDSRLEVTIHPPKEKITLDNRLYFQLLDAIDYINKTPIDNDTPYKIIAMYISKMRLNYQILLAYSFKYYNIHIIEKLAQIACEGF